LARPISDEELQLKKRARRRLVGAVLLVSVVAVVLPMVLDSEPKPPGQNVDIQIPSPDSGAFKPQGKPPAPGSAMKGTPEVTAKAESVMVPTPKPESGAPPMDRTPTPPPVQTEPTTPKITATPPPSSAAAPADRAKDAASGKQSVKSTVPAKSPESKAAGAYVVQVAALADPAKARDLEKRMSGAGLKTYTEVITTPTGEVTRVRAGPYATREAAEKARNQLKKAGLDGKIVPK
jgi:DedD protein